MKGNGPLVTRSGWAGETGDGRGMRPAGSPAVPQRGTMTPKGKGGGGRGVLGGEGRGGEGVATRRDAARPNPALI